MRAPKVKELFGSLLGLAGLLGFIGFVLHVLDKVRAGHGLDTYFTAYGVQTTYLGSLILMAIIPAALLAGWIIRIYSKGREQWSIRRWKAWKIAKNQEM